MSDSNKIHCLGEGQPTEEARVLLGESHASIEHVPMPTLFNTKVRCIMWIMHVEDLTDKIVKEGEIEIIML